jgi:CII-binding regulator of phage lambda lysogenization HflD
LYSKRLRTVQLAQLVQLAERVEKIAKEERDNSAAITAFIYILEY